MNLNYTWSDIAYDEVTHCKKCGKRIWKFWKAPTKEEKMLKGFKEEEMDLCSPCFNRRK
jgi:hypothetical protein